MDKFIRAGSLNHLVLPTATALKPIRHGSLNQNGSCEMENTLKTPTISVAVVIL